MLNISLQLIVNEFIIVDSTINEFRAYSQSRYHFFATKLKDFVVVIFQI
jgi:hypothetical protein